MKKGQRIVISEKAPFHANRKGFYCFSCDGPSRGIVVCSEEYPDQEKLTLFAVDEKFLRFVEV